MPATVEGSTRTDKYIGFEEKRWPLRVVSCQDDTSPPPDSRPQFKWEIAVEGAKDYDTGGELVRRMWCSTTWGEIPEKESHLVLIARALCGPKISKDEFEALDYPDLVGLRGSAFVKLDPKGWPTIDKSSFKPVGNAAPKNQATLPQTAAPAPAPTTANAPKRPIPPARPAGPEMITPAQAEQLAAHALKNYEMGNAALTAWVAENYAGKAVAQLTAEEATQAIETLSVPF